MFFREGLTMTIRKVPVKVAAYLMDKSEQFVRCGLQYERLKFGAAVSAAPSRAKPVYSYHISPKLFMEYTGCTIEDIVNAAKQLGVELTADSEE